MGAMDQLTRMLGAMLLVAAGAMAAMAALPVPASAAGPSIVVAPTTVAAGGTVTISGSVPTTGAKACALPEGVTITSSEALFPNGGFGPTVARDATGAFSLTYRVPTSTPPGSYGLGLRCAGGNVGVSATLAVTAVSPAPAGAVSGQANFTG
jgi:hypothetical protein